MPARSHAILALISSGPMLAEWSESVRCCRYVLIALVTALAGCGPQAASLELHVPEFVLSAAPVELTARVLDGQGEPIETAVQWTVSDARLAEIRGSELHCKAQGDVEVVGAVGAIESTKTAQCRPSAAIRGEPEIRRLVGARFSPSYVVVDGDGREVDAAGVSVAVEDASVLRFNEQGFFGLKPGSTTVTLTAGGLTKDVVAVVVKPFPENQVYVSSGARLAAVAVDGTVSYAYGGSVVDLPRHRVLGWEEVANGRGQLKAGGWDGETNKVLASDLSEDFTLFPNGDIWAKTGENRTLHRLPLDGSATEVDPPLPSKNYELMPVAATVPCAMRVVRDFKPTVPANYNHGVPSGIGPAVCLQDNQWKTVTERIDGWSTIESGAQVADGGNTLVTWTESRRFDTSFKLFDLVSNNERSLPVGGLDPFVGPQSGVFAFRARASQLGTHRPRQALFLLLVPSAHAPSPRESQHGAGPSGRTSRVMAEPVQTPHDVVPIALSPDGSVLLGGVPSTPDWEPGDPLSYVVVSTAELLKGNATLIPIPDLTGDWEVVAYGR
jgi:hypothetical protein